MKMIHNMTTLILLMSILGQSIETKAQAWGPKTRDAVIGTGIGAAAGAIINKRNRAVGGLIGGIAGGVGGYAIGSQGKKRWSPQAKGTAIGAGVGGAAGAIINKRNRVVGGVIGGIAGGAAGYAIGKVKDNKNKKEAARIAEANRVAAQQAEAERNAAAEARAAGHKREVDHRQAVAVASPKPSAFVQPVAMLAANTTVPSYVIPAGYLKNETYGDPNTPYGMSEYRRKSW